MFAHGQRTIDRDTEVVHGRLEDYRISKEHHQFDFNLLKLLLTSQPDELSFVGIQLESIRRHPSIDHTNTRSYLQYKLVDTVRLAENIELSVVSIAVNSQTVFWSYNWNVRCVQKKE